VLDEVQGRPGLEDAPHLQQRGCDVGDRAERPRRDGGVEAVVFERQRLAVETRPLHRDLRRRHPLRGQAPPDVGRLDRGDAGDGLRVERDVEPRAEAELDDLAFEASTDAASQRVVGLHPACGVDDPREDLLAVESHRSMMSR
jgi:hypothetical protein